MQRFPSTLATLLALAVLPGPLANPASAQKQGGILRIYANSNPPSASLHEETTIVTMMPFMAIYNNLVLFDQTKPKASPDTILPELATSWSYDPTNTRLTFKLRQGVTWHDGKLFTARDVKCTLDRLAGREPGYLRRNPRGIWFENVTDVALNGDAEATLVLKQPQASLLSMLAAGYTAMYPCHVSGRDMRIKPVGTGPFKLIEFKNNESIKLARNPDYWDKGKPYLDGIEYQIIPSRSTRILAFTSGNFDMTQAADITPPLIGDIHRSSPNATCNLYPTNVSTQMLIQRERPPFDNADLRLAMALAVDRKAFNDILLQGKAPLTGAMMPPPEGNWGLPPEELAKLPGYSTDVEARRAEARKIMEKLGYGPTNKLAIKVTTRDYNTFRDPAVILIDQLNKIHFSAELDVAESSLWYSRMFRRDYSVALNLTGSGVDDPDAVLKMFFSCKSDTNYSKYCNADVDRMLDRQSQETDPVKRKALVWDIERHLIKDIARPILYHGQQATCWHPQLKGFVQQQNSIYNNWRFAHVWLER